MSLFGLLPDVRSPLSPAQLPAQLPAQSPTQTSVLLPTQHEEPLERHQDRPMYELSPDPQSRPPTPQLPTQETSRDNRHEKE